MVDRNSSESSDALLTPQRLFVREPSGVSRFKDVGAGDLERAFGNAPLSRVVAYRAKGGCTERLPKRPLDGAIDP